MENNSKENTNLNEATSVSEMPKAPGGVQSNVDERDDAISSTTPDKFSEEMASVETDADFFTSELNISSVPTGKITENVEDIVQDLENLLGESDDSYRFSRESFEHSKLAASTAAAESYNEVNSSNVEDLMQDADLYQVGQSNLDTNIDLKPPEKEESKDLGDVEQESTSDMMDESVAVEVVKSNSEECQELQPEVLEESPKVSEVVEPQIEAVVDQNSILESQKMEEFSQSEISTNLEVEQSELMEENTSEVLDEPITDSVVVNADEGVVINLNNVPQDSCDSLKPEEVSSDSSKPEEVSSDSSKPEEVSCDSLKPEEVSCDSLKPEEVSSDSSKPEEVSSDSSKPEEVSCDSLKPEEVSCDSLKPEEVSSDSSKPEEVSSDSSKPEEVSCDSLKPEEVSCDSLKPEEVSSDSLKPEEVSCDSLKPEEVSCDSLKPEDGSCDSLKQEEDICDSLMPEEGSSDSIKPEEVSRDSLKPEEVSHDSLKPEEVSCDSSKPEEISCDSLKPEDGSCDSIKPDEVSCDSMKPEEGSCDSMKPEEAVEVVENMIESSGNEPVHENVLVCNAQTEQQIEEDYVSTAEIEQKVEAETCQNVSTVNTELVQPLTVQVDFNEHKQVATTTHEQSPDKTVQCDEPEKMEVMQLPQTSSEAVDSDDSRTNRAPLKMTISKNKSDNVHSILKIYDPSEAESNQSVKDEPTIPKITIKPILSPSESLSPKIVKSPSGSGSPRITIKPIVKPESLSPLKLTLRPYPKLEEMPSSPKLNIKPIVRPVDDPEIHHSPKITIKPIVKPPDELGDDRHSPRITIKPIIKPPEEEAEERHNPRITIKPIVKPQHEEEEKHSPRITIKPIIKPADESLEVSEEKHSPRITIKPIIKPPDEPVEVSEEKHSPRITIKPIVKPQQEEEEKHSPRITIKPIIKPADEPLEMSEEKHSPRITIKPIIKPPDEPAEVAEEKHSPRITIKPIVRPPEEVPKEDYSEEKHSPRITIKPVLKPMEEFTEHEPVHSPRITIKPIVKPPDEPNDDNASPPPTVQPFRLNIKPVVKPENDPMQLIDFEDQIKQERIVLKIAKNTKRSAPQVENEKLKKIKLKLSKQRGLAHIIPFKRSSIEEAEEQMKHFKTDLPSDLTISLIPNIASTTANTPDITITRVDMGSSSSSRTSTRQSRHNADDAISPVRNEKSLKAAHLEDIPDPLADIPVFEITLETAASMSSSSPKLPSSVASPAPRKRGRPRKVPLEVREEFKDLKEEEETPPPPPPAQEESSRPKRSCRGTSVRATLGIKPRKPRAPSTRGRGGKKAASTRTTTAKKSKERKPRYKLPKESMLRETSEFKPEFDIKDAEFKQVPLPGESNNREVVIYEEETRMSAENTSRAQTPAKQVLTSSVEGVEESQSSVQSNTTTESGEKTQKARKGPRLEVHQEPEGEVISADKLAEYSWGGGGPYMLQEQVAQFLGIKSFKRKYPGIQRRPVDMQERDFIRESCLASEPMCDMGLTAVRSEDILDIMYTDFQHKYEEYCKHQRDRQAKDVSNKQKALSLAASQEKTKLDIVEQAVQSAFQWNASFNKARREQRRACMDLQTFTVHFPKGKMKQVNKPSVGNYPLALVPGQYTDYYKKYSPMELNSLPLNTTGCKAVSIGSGNQDTEESQSDGSGSDSDSSSSDSDSSYSGSSGAEDCKMCGPAASTNAKKVLVH